MIATTRTELFGTKKKGKNVRTGRVEINSLYFDRKESERIGIALNSVFKLEKLYELITDITMKVLEVKCVSLMVLEGDALRIKSSKHIPEDVMKQCKVKLGVGISGWVALKGVPLLVKNVEEDVKFKRRNNKRYSNKSFISVPVIHNGRIIGVINVSDKNNNNSFVKNDVEFDLSDREMKLITVFHNHPDEVLSRDFLLDKVWGIDYPGTTRTLDQHIAQLRKKIEDQASSPRIITTVHGIGYRYKPL